MPGHDAVLKVVLFSVDGVRWGADADQIDQMLMPEEALASGVHIVPFHEAVPFRSSSVAYAGPKVLRVRWEDPRGRAWGILVDKPEAVITVKMEWLHPLPPFLAGNMGQTIIWGVVLLEGEIVLLADLRTAVETGFAHRAAVPGSH